MTTGLTNLGWKNTHPVMVNCGHGSGRGVVVVNRGRGRKNTHLVMTNRLVVTKHGRRGNQ